MTTELHYRVFALLLVVGLTLFVHAASAQTKLSDSEMKEIVRLLLERDVPPATLARLSQCCLVQMSNPVGFPKYLVSPFGN